MKQKKSVRFTTESLGDNKPDSTGRLFVGDYGFVDHSGVEIVGAFVDTVRQLFEGLPSQFMLQRLESLSQSKESIITLTDAVSSQKWHLSRMGKASGFRYKIQDNVEGLVILFGSFYRELDKPGQHLKIELSPHFISQRSTEKIWQRLHGQMGLSQLFLDDPEAKGVAVHLACDYQGYNLPSDFIGKFSTYSRTIRAYDGMASIDLSNIVEAVCTYGGQHQAKNYLIGKATALQLCLYDKSHEAIKSDKVDYLHREWGIYSFGGFDPEKTVRRIEARVHHTIMREIGLGLEKSFESFPDVVPFLTDIWRYALERNRLDVDETHKEIDPFWQLLIEDVYFYVPAKGLQICRKKKTSVAPLARLLSGVLGYQLGIWARKGLDVKRSMFQLRLQNYYPELLDYYKSRGLTENDLKVYVEKALCLKRLIGKAA